MKISFAFLFALITTVSLFGQVKASHDTLIVIGDLISRGDGDIQNYDSKNGYWIAKYKVIEVIKGNIKSDTLSVGYIYGSIPKALPQKALLKLLPFKVESSITNYFIEVGISEYHENIINKHMDYIKNASLSSPENSWQALLSALKTGETDKVKSVVTEKGFNNLIKFISPTNISNPLASTFQNWGNSWSKYETQWGQIKSNKVELIAGPMIKEHSFTFILTDSGWKMDSWSLGD